MRVYLTQHQFLCQLRKGLRGYLRIMDCHGERRSLGILFINVCKIRRGLKMLQFRCSLMDIFATVQENFSGHQMRSLIVWSTIGRLFLVNLTQHKAVLLLISSFLNYTRDIPTRFVSGQLCSVSFYIICVPILVWL